MLVMLSELDVRLAVGVVSTRLVYASALHKWRYLRALPNISQRTESAFHYLFWQMNTIFMGFLFVLGKIEIILSYSQY
jgi:hypothetical protein